MSAGNIAARLDGRARLHPDKPAVIEHARTVTFRQLADEVDVLARGLAAVGIGRGVRTVLMVKPGVEFFALTFALFKAGAIPVMVDPGMGRQHLGACLAEARPEAFVGIPLAHVARLLFGWGKPTVRTCVTVGRRWLWGGETLASVRARGAGAPAVQAPGEPGDTAAVLFTSGSTGVPKGALYTHGILSTQVDMLASHFGMGEADVDVPTFPLFALFDAALGATAVIPKMDFTRPARVDPREIVERVTTTKATQMFGSPALLDRVGRWGAAHGVKLPTLKRVISAGAPVPPAALERFASMLSEGSEIFTPYGATEALPVASIGHREILGETRALSAQGAGTCVGRPLEGLTVRVIKISDAPIDTWQENLAVPVGQIGELVVAGPVATAAYWNRPEATALAKIAVSDVGREGGFFHRMGDVGYLDDRGRIWFCGRKSHRVQTDAGTLFTIPVEAVFNQHPRVKRTALVGVGEPGRQRPVLCVELDPEAPGPLPPREQLSRELLALGAAHDHTRGIRDILFHEAFPVDVRHNSKIFREKLAQWAAGRSA